MNPSRSKTVSFPAYRCSYPPSSKGMRYFLNLTSDEQLAKHQQQLIGASKDDLVQVNHKYLHQPSKFGVTIIGPPNDLKTIEQDPSWNVFLS